MGHRGARERLLRAKFGVPCSISFRSELRAVSEAVSRARRDNEMVPMSLVSWRIDAISADSTRSGMLDTPREVLFSEPDGEGCLDVAPAAWLVLPGRCLMLKRQGRVRCFSQKSRELVISSKVRSPKILGEVTGLFKAPGDSQGFTFDGRIALFRRGQEP